MVFEHLGERHALLCERGSFDEDHGETGLEMLRREGSVAATREGVRESEPIRCGNGLREKREVSEVRKSDKDEGMDAQIQAPGLSATKRRLTAPPAGTETVSLRMGFTAPSVWGGLSSGSEEATSSAVRTIWYLWPWRWKGCALASLQK